MLIDLPAVWLFLTHIVVSQTRCKTMATPRLPSLLSGVWRYSADVYNPAMRSAIAARRMRAYHPSLRRHQQEQIPQRYGSANEPPPHLGGGTGIGPATAKPEEQAQALPKIGEKLQQDGEKEVKAEQQEQEQEQEQKLKQDPTTVDARQASRQMYDPMLDSSEALPTRDPPGSTRMPEDKPLESVLNTVPDQAPQTEKSDDQPHAEEHPDKTFDEHSPPVKVPHMEPPRYVHHFDTYGLVKRLGEGGWDQTQAITIMKAVRMMLAENTDLAKQALVSKSFLENEAYLFKAACAELKTEVTTRRKSEQEKMRTERTQLQHEVDILSQRLGQESGGLKDELKELFNDRKMAVRNEQRDMESKLQQLNYKITVSLQADARSEVEGLRWVMTRRVIITLALVVLMVLGSIKMASNATHDMEEAAKRAANIRSGGTQTETDEEGGGGSREAKILGGGGVLVKDGDNPAFVSLG